MSITRDIKITIKNEIAELDSKLFVYQYDNGIDIYFDVLNSRYNFRHSNYNFIKSLSARRASASIVKPDGTAFKKYDLEIIENKIKFTITKDLTDELTEIGEYLMQFHIHDDLNNRITIPPISFEVKELIANISDDGTVGQCLADSAVVQSDIEIYVYEGKYIKTNWKSGDVITSNKLNKIENALEGIDVKLDEKSDIHEHPYKLDTYVPSWGEITDKPSEFNPSYHNHNTSYYLKTETKSSAEIDSIISDINTSISAKVDKVSGKGLSANDFTTGEKTKLSKLENYVHPESHSAKIITEDATHRFVTDVEKASWNSKAEEKHSHSNYVTNDNLNSQLAKKSDVTHNHNVSYYLKNETYNKSEVDTAIANVEVDLTGYATETFVTTKDNENFQKAKDYTDLKISEINNLVLETVAELPQVGVTNKVYLVKNIDTQDNLYTEYIWLDNKWEIFGSASIDLSSYATKEEVSTQLNNKSDKTHNHNDLYANKTSEHTHSNKSVIDNITGAKVDEWNNKEVKGHKHNEYLTELPTHGHNYNDLNNKPIIPSKTSELQNDSGFITSADIDTSQNHIHSNKTVLDGITANKVTVWDKKSDFNGDYNSLTNKPNIPSIEGLASESYVNTKVSELVNSAPETLDTLKELSNALGNDPNFATTVAKQIGTKADTSYVNDELKKKSNIHEHPYKPIDYVPTWNEVVSKPELYTKQEVNTLVEPINNAIIIKDYVVGDGVNKYLIGVALDGELTTQTTELSETNDVILKSENGICYKVVASPNGELTTQRVETTNVKKIYIQTPQPFALIFVLGVLDDGTLITSPISDIDVIKDDSLSINKTWSSAKIKAEIDNMISKTKDSEILMLRKEIEELRQEIHDRKKVVSNI